MQPTTLKTNWIRQLYYYIIIAGTLTAFCYGTFTFGRAALIRYVFPKAGNSYYGGYNNPEMQCAQSGNQYYYPKSMSKFSSIMDQKIPMEQPLPTAEEIKECKEATVLGIADEKDRSFQYDAVKGLSLMFITGIVQGGHYFNKKFFLSKE
jgi:hypothetical protein